MSSQLLRPSDVEHEVMACFHDHLSRGRTGSFHMRSVLALVPSGTEELLEAALANLVRTGQLEPGLEPDYYQVPARAALAYIFTERPHYRWLDKSGTVVRDRALARVQELLRGQPTAAVELDPRAAFELAIAAAVKTLIAADARLAGALALTRTAPQPDASAALVDRVQLLRTMAAVHDFTGRPVDFVETCLAVLAEPSAA